MKSRSAQQRFQSGQPGGGKGRREEVRGSGVYPGSGPLPPGEAKVETPATFVRHQPGETRSGSRGAAAGQPRTGGRTAAARTRVPPKRAAAHQAVASQLTQFPQEVAAEHWEDFLNDFSRQHEGWDSQIRVFLPDGAGRMQSQGLPFEGISLDYKANECTTTVSAGTEASDHLQRLVPRTTRIIALNQDELEIDAADHSRTLVRCQRPGR